ncbi:MAG: Uma2 family endonuclease [Vulcanimicrobiota bacterium]
MSLAHQKRLLTVEEYLSLESTASVKSEYLAGVLYQMAGGSNAHNQLATNAIVALGSRLRGGPCRVFNSDTKIRIQLAGEVRFYYPDLSVIWARNPPTDSFQDAPRVVFEVLSESTRRVDEGEKRDAYLGIRGLTAYVLVEQGNPVVSLWRRGEDGFTREQVTGLDGVLPLPEIGCELPLSELYDGLD